MPRRKFSPTVDRIKTAWRNSRVADAFGRDRRRDMVSNYAGCNWAEQTDEVDIMLNMSSMYVQITAASLIPKVPRFTLSTWDRSQLEACDVMQDDGNRELKRMNAAETIKRIVIDALFGWGIYRVALATMPEAATRGWGQQGGEPILTRIDREDYAYDNFAGVFNECQWQAHSYRVRLDAVQEDKRFTKYRKDIKPTLPQQYDEYGVEKIGVLNRSFYGMDEVFDMVALWEFYFPTEREIWTFITDGAGSPVACADGQPLGRQPWTGPERGPYGHLGYYWVPGSPVPKGPLQDLYQADLACNALYRKAFDSVERYKEMTAYSSEEDALRANKASDGEGIYVEDPRSLVPVTTGGQTFQQAYGGGQAARELFDFQGGNLAIMGGRSQQAKTATQEQILNQNAQAGISDLQQTTMVAVNDMVDRLCWYWWKHPFKVGRSLAEVPGLPGISHMRYAFPSERHDRHQSAAVRRAARGGIRREADFDDLMIEVDVSSLVPSTPQSRLATLRSVWQQDVMPAMTIMMGQGLAADFNQYFKLLGELLNEPRVEQVLTVREPPPDQGGQTQDAQGPKPNVPRTYNRVSSSEATDTGQGRNQITQLITGNSQGGRQNGSAPPAMNGRGR
jgi:hypothetical protein